MSNIIKWANYITVGNGYLGNYAKQFNNAVEVLPSTVDMVNVHYLVKEHEQQVEQIKIGWTGSHTTAAKYLPQVIDIINELSEKHPIEFMVISNQEPDFEISNLHYIPWSKATEIDDLIKFDIGIMPIGAEEWEKGKCSFKAIQYMALGIPVVLSPYGNNLEVVEDGKSGLFAESKADWTNAISGVRTQIETGGAFTGNGYYGAWVTKNFWLAAINTGIIVSSVVVISLTLGTLGGYALARSGKRYAFYLLMLALVFRAMPHITLVSGYLLPFFEWNLWGHIPTAIIVMVAINQPFTLWMLHSFFLNIPKDLDESAMVDGCTRFQAFRHVIIPVMWPGVVTTGLFSFLLAYNDFTVTATLLSQANQTMVPKIASFLGTTQTEGNVMFAVAAVVSATAPLFVLILFFQRQIVSGLTAGAVKG